jgi:putative oxidoreductase
LRNAPHELSCGAFYFRRKQDGTEEEMTDIGQEPRPLVGALGPFYAQVVPLAWPLVRLAIGWNLMVHGWGKIMAGAGAVLPAYSAIGFSHPLAMVYLSTWLEFIGGICIALGLFTRFFAAAIAIELAYITFGLYWPNGFSWLKRGYEYTLMWGWLSFAIALRGGGPWSLDRLIRREL